jgi:hypothetical protein
MKIFILEGITREGCEGWISDIDIFTKAFSSFAEAEAKMNELNKNANAYVDFVYDIYEVEL